MAYNEDQIALAAEYALGTLDADERAQVETLMAVDKEYAAIVQAWEFRLGVLNQMVGSVEPRPLVWDNIRRAIGHGEQAPLVLPEAPPPIAPALILTVDAATRNFTVRKVGAQPEAGKSYELWIVSDKLQRPRSLGVIGNNDFTARPILAAYDSEIVNQATFAVSIEPQGG